MARKHDQTRVPIAALVYPARRSAIEAAAAAEGRSVSNMVEQLIGQALAQRGFSDGAAA
jgi:uncharacterized protein (DUF1778 family)